MASEPSPMEMALEEARAAAARGEVPIGAVIVQRRRGAGAGRQPHDRARRPDRPCRDAGDPGGGRGGRLAAPDRRRPLCDAGALRHVRGGDFLRPHPPALFRRERPEKRRGGKRRALLRRPDLPPRAGRLWRHGEKAKRRRCSGISSGRDARRRRPRTRLIARATSTSSWWPACCRSRPEHWDPARDSRWADR